MTVLCWGGPFASTLAISNAFISITRYSQSQPRKSDGSPNTLKRAGTHTHGSVKNEHTGLDQFANHPILSRC